MSIFAESKVQEKWGQETADAPVGAEEGVRVCRIEGFGDLEEELVRETEERHYEYSNTVACVDRAEIVFLLSGVAEGTGG